MRQCKRTRTIEFLCQLLGFAKLSIGEVRCIARPPITMLT